MLTTITHANRLGWALAQRKVPRHSTTGLMRAKPTLPNEKSPYHQAKNLTALDLFLPQLKRIIEHPFHQAMYAGTLPKDDFLLFLNNDVTFYLPRAAEAARSISILLADNSKPIYSEQFAQLHARIKSYTERIYDMYPVLRTPKSHTLSFFKPTSRINHQAFIEFAEHLFKDGVLSVRVARSVACLWLYLQLGLHMDLSRCAVNNAYRPWLATYSRPGFVDSTTDLLQTLCTLINDADNVEKENIMMAFKESLNHELAILNSVYPHDTCCESWKLPLL